MKFRKITFMIVLIMALVNSPGFSKPRVNIIGRDPYKINTPMSPDAITKTWVLLNANNIASFFINTGIFNQDLRSVNTPGLEWPKGAKKFACFTSGLSIGCFINGRMAQVMASYTGEYVPGTVVNKQGFTSLDFKIYTVRAGDNSGNNPDYANWYKMVPYGAPYTDINNNKIYDQDIDIPGQRNAGQTFFLAMTDALVDGRNSGEGFGGGISSPLLFADVRLTAWAYTSPGLEDLQFVNWLVINRGDSAWNRTYMGVVVDPDLGDATDDYIGCDTTLDLGYCYNGDNIDGDGNLISYGIAPPAFGMDYFKSPIIKNTDPALNDTLGLTSFVFFTNNGSSPPPCESDPNGEPYPAYLMLTGVKKDGSPYLDPTKIPPVPTKYVYYGDPETQVGWTESKGSVQNCGGVNGTTIPTNPKGDRRFIFNSGRESFTVQPGDTQNLVLAQFVARGSSNVNSVTKLKNLSKTAQIIYDNDFNVTPPPPPPVVSYNITPKVNGLCNIILNWGDASESFRYWDTIFFQKSDSNIYTFQGYEIYEISKLANTIPDFTKPETINPAEIQLIDIFDRKDGIGAQIDTFSTGVTINSQEQYAPYPILPPYKMTMPQGFPDKGVSRSIYLTGTKFAQNYGGQSNFIVGQEYQFAVVAYTVSASKRLKRGFKVLRNSVGSQLLKIRPIAPPAGTVYTMVNGDTLNTNVRDLGLCPIVRDMTLLNNATYRVVFSGMADIWDTTYSILRKLDGQANFDTLKSKLKYVNVKAKADTKADDSSRTYDGIFFNLQRIRFTTESEGLYRGNYGVVRDPDLGSDSIQTRRKGWEYVPASNQFLTGSKYLVEKTKPWQSKSMTITFPSKNTHLDLTSTVTPEMLKTAKIVFTNSGQKAYYYRDTIGPDGFRTFKFTGMRDVPFKVYEAEYYDATPNDKQINCAFVESREVTGQYYDNWHPTADSLGGKLTLYIMTSNYSDTVSLYQNTDLFKNQKKFDIQYIWSPRLIAANANFTENDMMFIYPYTITRPYIEGNIPLFYEFKTIAPLFGDIGTASKNNVLEQIRVVPNPYYGFSTLDRTSIDRFVTFRNLPLECTIKIYTLNGDMIRILNKTKGGNVSTSSTIEWNLQNSEKVPVSSGIYIALIDAPGIGQKVLKIIMFTAQERINF